MAKSKEALLEEAAELGLELTEEEREDYKLLQAKVKEARGSSEGDEEEASETPEPPGEKVDGGLEEPVPAEVKDEEAEEPKKDEEPKEEKREAIAVKEPKRITHIVTEEDLKVHFSWTILGIQPGDVVELASELDVVGVNSFGAENQTRSGEVVDIVKENGEFVRYYSSDIHGEGFRKAAEEFLSHTHGCSMASGVSRITVEYSARRMPEGNWYQAQKVFTGPTFRENAIRFANEIGPKAVKWAH